MTRLPYFPLDTLATQETHHGTLDFHLRPIHRYNQRLVLLTTLVLSGHREPPPAWHDVLVTLGPGVPGCFSRFERVAEVIGIGEEDKNRARERFRFYRDRGYPLETHEI